MPPGQNKQNRFNSKMVQLKVAATRQEISQAQFQFQNGTIKRTLLLACDKKWVYLFQFQNGTIKRCLIYLLKMK